MEERGRVYLLSSSHSLSDIHGIHTKKNDTTFNWYFFYIIASTGMHLTYTIRKSISFKDLKLKQSLHQRCFHGCHENKYTDFYDFKLISAKYFL